MENWDGSKEDGNQFSPSSGGKNDGGSDSSSGGGSGSDSDAEERKVCGLHSWQLKAILGLARTSQPAAHELVAERQHREGPVQHA